MAKAPFRERVFPKRGLLFASKYGMMRAEEGLPLPQYAKRILYDAIRKTLAPPPSFAWPSHSGQHGGDLLFFCTNFFKLTIPT